MSDNQHIETFKATAEGKGWATTVAITGTEWTIQVDEPEEDGGGNSGPNPMQYFAASLVSCQNEQAQVVAEELELDINGIDISVELDLDLSGFMGMAEHSDGSYKRVQLHAIVSGKLSADQASELGKRVDARCPILGLLRAGGAEIESAWEVK